MLAAPNEAKTDWSFGRAGVSRRVARGRLERLLLGSILVERSIGQRRVTAGAPSARSRQEFGPWFLRA